MVKIVSAIDEIPAHLEDNKRVIKLNLPDNEPNFISGNGEGMWGYVKNESDMEKYDKGSGQFEVILLNQSVYYYGYLKYGDIVVVEGRGEAFRPVLIREYFDFLQAGCPATFNKNLMIYMLQQEKKE